MHLSIGTFLYHINGLPREWLSGETAKRLGRFAVDPDTRHTDTFRLSIVDTIDTPPQTQFKELFITRFFCAHERDRHFFITDEMKSVINWTNKTMNIQLLPPPAWSELDNIGKIAVQLRLLTSFLTVAHGGLPFHCSCVAKNNRALLFFGKSGAGKTTIARIMQKNGWQLLNDEYNLLLPREDSFRVFSTPFTRRMTAEEMYAPVGGANILGTFNLHQGAFSVKKTAPEETMKIILESTYLFPDFNRIQEQLLTVAFAVSRRLPMMTLTFRNRPETAGLLENHLPEIRQ